MCDDDGYDACECLVWGAWEEFILHQLVQTFDSVVSVDGYNRVNEGS